MLKEAETEKTRLFCHIFIIGSIFIGGGGGGGGEARATCPPWLHLQLDSRLGLHKNCTITFQHNLHQ